MNNEKDNVYDLVEDFMPMMKAGTHCSDKNMPKAFYEWKHGKAKKTVIYIVVGII